MTDAATRKMVKRWHDAGYCVGTIQIMINDIDAAIDEAVATETARCIEVMTQSHTDRSEGTL